MKTFFTSAAVMFLLCSPAFAAVQTETGPKVTDVWVAFKTHFDIGYTDTIENVLKKYRVAMMDQALKIIDQERQLPAEQRFAWLVPGWPLKHILGPMQDPAQQAQIEQAVREGSLSVVATPFSLHSETEDLEDLVRGVGLSSAICRQHGRPLPVAAKMTDVPCHSWVWPTVLSRAGVKFLQIGCNGASGHLKAPSLFWWEGPDGSRVLCNYTPDYGSGIIPPKNWPAKNYLAMIMTSDNQGPPSLADVENIRRYAEKNLPGVRVHFGTLDDFANALAAENPDLPVVRADMPDTWIHGWMSMPVESKLAHSIRPFQPALETLDTQLRAGREHRQRRARAGRCLRAEHSLQRAHVRPVRAQRRAVEQPHAAISLRRRVAGGL